MAEQFEEFAYCREAGRLPRDDGSIPKEDKPAIMLRALLQGHDVVWRNRKLSIIRDAGGRARVVVRGQELDLSSRESREIYIGLDLTLAGFVNWCEELADEDVFILAANCALTDLCREERARRRTCGF